MQKAVCFLILLLSVNIARAEIPATCVGSPEMQVQRSAELQSIKSADQIDRQGSPESIDWSAVSPRDLQRRMRVAEIFAEGCFSTAQDYSAAALVFQHGNTSDHFFQTFIWSKKAVELGDPTQKWLMAAGLDRYLVNIGQKQLFATQGGKDAGSDCWCLEPVEESFPIDRRNEYGKRSLAEALDWIHSLNGEKPGCLSVQYCNHFLKPTPAGSVLGFW